MKQKKLTPLQFYDAMAPHYDSFMEKGESTLDDELNLVKKVIADPCSVLDVGCGSGRITLPLYKLGYNAAGLDISKSMIAVAREKGLENLFVGDIISFEYGGKPFEAIVSLHMGFSYVNDKNTMNDMIKRCHQLLVPSGKLIWDSPNQEFYGKKRVMSWPAGNKNVETICYGHDEKEVRSVIANNGFSIKQVWGSYTPLQEFKSKLPRIIVYAKRGD